MMTTVILTVIGVFLILATARDVVHELFHPEDTGSMSRAVTTVVWRIVRGIAKRYRPAVYHAGPLVLISVMLMWTILLATGWTLIIWPRLPGSFNVDPHLPAAATQGVGAASYISLASMTTLSASDFAPRTEFMRWAIALESFVGPLLVTAWISWVLSIYPVLADRRAFAHRINLLRRANGDPARAATDVPTDAVIDNLRSLSQAVFSITAQLRQSRVTYYFQNDKPQLSLARQLPWALALGRAACAQASPPALAHYGRVLDDAVVDLLSLLGREYLDLDGASPERILAALADDHLLEDRQDEA